MQAKGPFKLREQASYLIAGVVRHKEGAHFRHIDACLLRVQYEQVLRRRVSALHTTYRRVSFQVDDSQSGRHRLEPVRQSAIIQGGHSCMCNPQ